MNLPRTITVTGSGATAVVPDVAVVSLSLAARSERVAQALSTADDLFVKAVEIAAAHDAQPRTGGVSVWPVHDNEGVPRSFEARHQVSMRARSVSAAGEILTALAEQLPDRLGESWLQLEGVSLEIGDPAAANVAATEAAYADAVAQAERLAALARGSLGQVVTVQVGGAGYGGPPMMADAVAAGKAVSIEPGTTQLHATVTVTFELA